MGMKKKWIKVFRSFGQAEEFDRRYYRSMSPEERLDTVQLLRESYRKFNLSASHASGGGQAGKGGLNAYRKGLRGFIKVVKPA